MGFYGLTEKEAVERFGEDAVRHMTNTYNLEIKNTT